MDTKWKKWCNSLCITIVIIAMAVGGVHAVNECNKLASLPCGISMDDMSENPSYLSGIEQRLMNEWTKQENLISEDDRNNLENDSEMKIGEGAFIDAELVIIPYGKKRIKKSSNYSNTTKEYKINGNEWEETITIQRDASKRQNSNGSFAEWGAEGSENDGAYSFYQLRASSASGETISLPDSFLIDDEKAQRLESATIKITFTEECMAQIRQQYADGQNVLKKGLKEAVFLVGGELLGIVLLIVLFSLQKQRTRFFAAIDKIWWEVIVGTGMLLITGAGGILVWVSTMTQDYSRGNYVSGMDVEMAVTMAWMVVPVILGLFVICLQTTVWRLKERKLLDSTLCIGYFRKWYRAAKQRRQMEYEVMNFADKHTKDRIRQYHRARKLVVVFIVLSVCSIGTIGFFGVAAAVLGCFGIKYLGTYFDKLAEEQRDLMKLVDQIHRISEGELTAATDISKDSEYYAYSQKLTNIGSGMEKALETQMKGERMKIDLITNVSHDLKTPLTSIIGYVDLLSRDESLSDEAKDYVQILTQKTDRLKNIISDLFELAKSTSGEAKVELEPMDMRKLVEQTLVDMTDQIEESGFVIRFNCQEESAKFNGDVNRMYRVVQNVIENALKYSLKGTRIFIQITKDSENVRLEIINTASYEMDFTEEEIMERFARAEKSRTSEGNGLGLSIADSFTKNCGGNFHIEIQGDQFKVILTFPQI